jgi:hypothetical protein
MTTNFQTNPQNQPFAKGESISSNTINPNSRSAVPIFVYQQLVENFHRTQAELTTTKQINQELVSQNQQLRQEIITILQTVEQVQHNIQSLNIPQFSKVQNNFVSNQLPQNEIVLQGLQELINEEEMEMMDQPIQESINLPVVVPSDSKVKPVNSTMGKVKKKRPKPPVKKEKLPIKEYQNGLDLDENANTLNGWLLFLAILLIVITAFGAGFVVMRPLLNPTPSIPSIPSNN